MFGGLPYSRHSVGVTGFDQSLKTLAAGASLFDKVLVRSRLAIRYQREIIRKPNARRIPTSKPLIPLHKIVALPGGDMKATDSPLGTNAAHRPMASPQKLIQMLGVPRQPMQFVVMGLVALVEGGGQLAGPVPGVVGESQLVLAALEAGVGQGV